MGWECLDVQAAQISGAGASLQLAAFAVNPEVDDLIVVNIDNWNSSPARAINAPTDTAGNTYSQVGTGQISVDGSMGQRMYYTIVTIPGSTFRVTVSCAATIAALTGNASLWRHSTTGTPTYNGDYKSNTGISVANPSSGTTTPAPDADSVFVGGMMRSGGSGTATDGTGWNDIANGFTSGMRTLCRLTVNSPTQDLYVEYKLASSAQNAQWTLATDTWSVIAGSWAAPVVTTSAVVTGTTIPSVTENELGIAGETIIMTITGDTIIPN